MRRLPKNRLPTPSGEVFQEDFLVPLGITQKEAAARLHISVPRMNEIVRGKRAVTSGHAAKLSRQLAVLNRASGPPDMNLPGWSLHPLKGSLSEHWSVSVSGNWRLTFTFDNGDLILIDYQDYHSGGLR